MTMITIYTSSQVTVKISPGENMRIENGKYIDNSITITVKCNVH